ncbi:MAG: hypothetical protein ACYDHW_06930 [Syntrophorhabdaceae bacterium]
MSQVTDFVTPGTPLTMAALKTFLDNCYDAGQSLNSGSSAPSNPIVGMLWLDTSGGATAYILKLYTAGGWVSILNVNSTAGTYSIPSPTLVTPAMQIGSDADGDMYYRASSVLARLAKGAANLKMFMNAAGTAPEWATEFKIITATRDLTAGAGDVAYTGVGFKPAGFIMAGTASNNDLNEFTLGFAIGTGMANICLFPRATPVWGMTTTRVVISERGASDGSKNQTAIVKTMDADGFTLTWSKTSTPSGTLTMYILCFR